MSPSDVPTPSHAVLVKVAGIASREDDILAPENPVRKACVWLSMVTNDRRRAMEAAMLLLTDPELRKYLAQ